MFEKIDFDFLHDDYFITNIFVYNTPFANCKSVDYLKTGRKKNLLFCINSGVNKYKFNNKSITVSKNTAIFIPHGTKYFVKSPMGEENVVGIGLSFDLIDKFGNEIHLQENIYTKSVETDVKKQFLYIFELYKKPIINFSLLKSAVYKLICLLFENTNSCDYKAITPALEFISEHYRENLAVMDYAKQCNLSESYFRKLFREQTGKSPIEYRNTLRFNDAIVLYKQGYSLQEIAEILGFYNAGYLSKIYKTATGSTIKKDSLSV